MTITYATNTYGTAFTKGIPITAYVKHNYGEQSLVFYWTGITYIDSIYRIYCYTTGEAHNAEAGVVIESILVLSKVPVTVLYI